MDLFCMLGVQFNHRNLFYARREKNVLLHADEEALA